MAGVGWKEVGRWMGIWVDLWLSLSLSSGVASEFRLHLPGFPPCQDKVCGKGQGPGLCSPV